MRRRAVPAALLAGGLVLSACGGSPGPGDDRVRLQFTLFGDPVETAGYQRLVDAFEREHSDVTVEITPVARQDDLLAKLATGFAGGSPPDTFLINYRRYGQFAARGALEPVQGRLTASDVLDEGDFAPPALDAFRFDGRELTCLPQNVSSLAVYYNVDLFERAGLPLPRPGWTWDDFLAAAQALTGGGRYGTGTDPSLIRLAPFVWSAGGEVVDDPTTPTRLTLDAPEARRGLDFFLDLQTRHGVAPPDREEQARDSEARFLDGDLGMLLDSRRAVPTLRTIEGFRWDVAPVPVAPGGRPVTILHGDAYCLSRGGDHVEQTWQFVEYANSRAGQELLAESGRTVPSRPDVASSPAFLRPDAPPASSRVFLDAVPTVRAFPHTAAWPQVEAEADRVLTEMWYGRLDREAGLRRLAETTGPLLR